MPARVIFSLGSYRRGEAGGAAPERSRSLSVTYGRRLTSESLDDDGRTRLFRRRMLTLGRWQLDYGRELTFTKQGH